MTVLDGPAGKVALRLINKFGRRVTYLETFPGAYNRATGKTDVPAPTEHAVKAVFQRVDIGLVGETINGTEVKVEDEEMFIPGRNLDFSPNPKDMVRDGGQDYQIIRADPIRSGEDAALWRILVSR